MKRIMIDEYNNKFEVSYKTPQTFFNRHGGNSVLIQQDDEPTNGLKDYLTEK